MNKILTKNQIQRDEVALLIQEFLQEAPRTRPEILEHIEKYNIDGVSKVVTAVLAFMSGVNTEFKAGKWSLLQ